MAKAPRHLLANNLGLPAAEFANVPKRKSAIVAAA
jgi:hypothetical protein